MFSHSLLLFPSLQIVDMTTARILSESKQLWHRSTGCLSLILRLLGWCLMFSGGLVGDKFLTFPMPVRLRALSDPQIVHSRRQLLTLVCDRKATERSLSKRLNSLMSCWKWRGPLMQPQKYPEMKGNRESRTGGSCTHVCLFSFSEQELEK